jgi:hypothetical protein
MGFVVVVGCSLALAAEVGYEWFRPRLSQQPYPLVCACPAGCKQPVPDPWGWFKVGRRQPEATRPAVRAWTPWECCRQTRATSCLGAHICTSVCPSAISLAKLLSRPPLYRSPTGALAETRPGHTLGACWARRCGESSCSGGVICRRDGFRWTRTKSALALLRVGRLRGRLVCCPLLLVQVRAGLAAPVTLFARAVVHIVLVPHLCHAATPARRSTQALCDGSHVSGTKS